MSTRSNNMHNFNSTVISNRWNNKNRGKQNVNTGSVRCIGKSVGNVSCSSVKESMRTAVLFSEVAYFRDLNLELALPRKERVFT